MLVLGGTVVDPTRGGFGDVLPCCPTGRRIRPPVGTCPPAGRTPPSRLSHRWGLAASAGRPAVPWLGMGASC